MTGKTDEEYLININGLVIVRGLLNDLTVTQAFVNNVSYYQGSLQLVVGSNPFKVTS